MADAHGSLFSLNWQDVKDACGWQNDEWYVANCHAASLALVRTGLLGPFARVARGLCDGVAGQHSWAVTGDPYDPDQTIVDITAWTQSPGYDRPKVWVACNGIDHTPHGWGSILTWGVPRRGDGPRVDLNENMILGRDARDFLSDLYEHLEDSADDGLDLMGWNMLLSHAPVEDWPAREIMRVAYETPALKALIPIDRLGMVTDLNPSNLYW